MNPGRLTIDLVWMPALMDVDNCHGKFFELGKVVML
jgi:hypothetical protein